MGNSVAIPTPTPCKDPQFGEEGGSKPNGNATM